MVKNYMLIAWRTLIKNRLFSFINIFGLALSMSVCMLVLLRIIDGFQYDRFHPATEYTYRIISTIDTKNGDRFNLATTPLPLREALLETSIVNETVSIYPAPNTNAGDGVTELPLNWAFTQPAFFRIFGFTLKYGDVNTALNQPNSIVLSEMAAHKFFGDTNPLGKNLLLKEYGNFQVTGVISSPPGKTHLHHSAYASFSSVDLLEKEGKLPTMQMNWDTFERGYTYVKLHDQFNETSLVQELQALATTLNTHSEEVTISFNSQSISSITPGWTELFHETSRGSSWGKLITEAGIGLIILLAAGFNYTNLSVARALTRSKEVGIRKLSGATRSQIFGQYIAEAIIVALFALCVALGILSIILEFKPFNDGYEMVPDLKITPYILLCFLAFAIFAGIIAGVMPAWILSAFKPIQGLRGIGTNRVFGNLSIRKSLMVFQFTLSLVIIIFLSAFYQQFSYVASADPGFSSENILVLPPGSEPEAWANRVTQVSGVESVAFTSNHFGGRVSDEVTLREYINFSNEHKLPAYFADRSLIEMMNLTLVAGENFSPVPDKRYILLNERSVSQLGYNSPADVVGRQFFLSDSTEVQVKGVIKDFYHRDVGNRPEALVFLNSPDNFRQMLVKVEPSSRDQVKARVEFAWKQQYEGAFSSIWLDKKIEEMNSQSATLSLLGFLAFMTIAIAAMGLLGLVVYTVETRRKEIAIRKIVGASIAQILTVLSKGYVTLLLISGGLAMPVGYLTSNFFLLNFVNRISFGIGSLLLCFSFLLIIGLVTILSQAYRAGMENPSRSIISD